MVQNAMPKELLQRGSLVLVARGTGDLRLILSIAVGDSRLVRLGIFIHNDGFSNYKLADLLPNINALGLWILDTEKNPTIYTTG